MKVNVADAKNILTELVRAVEDGESVAICRGGVPVVDLVRRGTRTGQEPRFGTLRGKIAIHDPDWWKPIRDGEAETFGEGHS